MPYFSSKWSENLSFGQSERRNDKPKMMQVNLQGHAKTTLSTLSWPLPFLPYHLPAPTLGGGIMIPYEQCDRTSPANSLGAIPGFLDRPLSMFNQPTNGLTMSYSRPRVQALRKQNQSCRSRRIQQRMPNHFPKLHPGISSTFWGLDMPVLPRQSCWEDTRPPLTGQSRSTGMTSLDCLCATLGLVHPQRPPSTHTHKP